MSLQSSEGLQAGQAPPTFALAAILIAGYLTIQFASNLTVTKFVSIIYPYSIPIGSLLYAVSFTWIDLINQTLGRRNARLLVLISIGSNVFLALWLQFFILLPGDDRWSPDNQNSVRFVFDTIPRIYLASWLTTFISENIDITIFHHLRLNKPTLPIYARAIISNVPAAIVDAFLFSILAFAGSLPAETILLISMTGAAYKAFVGIISLPLLILVRKYSSSQEPQRA